MILGANCAQTTLNEGLDRVVKALETDIRSASITGLALQEKVRQECFSR